MVKQRFILPYVWLYVIMSFLLMAMPAAADDYSRHCTINNGESEVTLRKGTYEGTWEEELVFTYNHYGVRFTQTYRYEGTFRLKIDNKPHESGWLLVDTSELSGEVRISHNLSGSAVPMTASQIADGKGSLKLDEEVGNSEFTALMDLQASGMLTIRTPEAVVQKGSNAQGQHTLKFVAEQADCNGASGRVHHEASDDFIAIMEKGGYRVQRTPARWRMSRVEDASDPIRKLKEELQKPAPQGIVRTREVEARRLGTIADNIKKEPEDLQDCLWPIWLDHVLQLSANYVSQDIVSLHSYNGDWQGLQSLVMQALDADRSLSLMGRDTCSEALHNQLWEALSGALSRYLEKMADGRAPLAHILEVDRQGELLGVISPGLRNYYWQVLKEEALRWADVAWEAYVVVRDNTPGTLLEQSSLPTFRNAIEKALVAEKAAVALGNDLERVLKELDRINAAKEEWINELIRQQEQMDQQ